MCYWYHWFFCVCFVQFWHWSTLLIPFACNNAIAPGSVKHAWTCEKIEHMYQAKYFSTKRTFITMSQIYLIDGTGRDERRCYCLGINEFISVPCWCTPDWAPSASPCEHPAHRSMVRCNISRPRQKWSPFCRRHFQIHMNEKYCILILCLVNLSPMVHLTPSQHGFR